MKTNVGTIDRIIRLVILVAAIGLYFGNIVTGTLGIVLLVVGVVMGLTALVSTCPLYSIIGVSTCPLKTK